QDRDEDETASRKFDLIYRGQELSSGGQREHRLDVLMSAMEEQGVDKSNFTFYLESFKFGMPPHGGYGLGVDRLVTKLLDLDNIKESILFPRDPNRLTP
ncbi:MAG: amino acid--tRNA ligase-related protein, partial [Candidatus Nanohaloarchaea archaeon]|nr:amino acid--tRNA ligase-related protein [Candidatus Nanohaloarchaea archaeon]